MKKVINIRLLIFLSLLILIMGSQCMAGNILASLNNRLDITNDSNTIVLAGQDARVALGQEVERVVVFPFSIAFKIVMEYPFLKFISLFLMTISSHEYSKSRFAAFTIKYTKGLNQCMAFAIISRSLYHKSPRL